MISLHLGIFVGCLHGCVYYRFNDTTAIQLTHIYQQQSRHHGTDAAPVVVTRLELENNLTM